MLFAETPGVSATEARDDSTERLSWLSRCMTVKAMYAANPESNIPTVYRRCHVLKGSVNHATAVTTAKAAKKAPHKATTALSELTVLKDPWRIKTTETAASTMPAAYPMSSTEDDIIDPAFRLAC